MFYRESETNCNNGIKLRNDSDDQEDGEDGQIIRNTNFSITEILRPEFGQRKPENIYPESLPGQKVSTFNFVETSVAHTRPMFTFDDIFQRYRTLMCSASHQGRHSASGSFHHSKESICDKSHRQQHTVSNSSQKSSTESPNLEGRENGSSVWPAWVYCTRYSDRPSAGPRAKKTRHRSKPSSDEKRPRTAFTSDQLQRLKKEFNECRYLTEKRRVSLANELNLTESQIKIWFQNKRAKVKKTSDAKNTLALNLIAEGLYNHSTIKATKSDSDTN